MEIRYASSEIDTVSFAAKNRFFFMLMSPVGLSFRLASIGSVV
jgi:hypothetical protein